MTTVTVLDGGMGRELARMGAPFGQPEWSALALMEAPETVGRVHRAYISAGAQVISTNSYALVPFHIGTERFEREARSLCDLAGRLAREAADECSDRTVLVAACLPPLFGSYRPDLFDGAEAARLLAPLIEGLSPHVDIWLAETLSAIAEARVVAALLAQDERPRWYSYTLKDEAADCSGPARLRSGELVEDATRAALECGAQAILFNCSQPEVMAAAVIQALAELKRMGKEIAVGVYANAFPPQPEDATANEGLSPLREDLDPAGYTRWVRQWVSAGATIIGGCCGIGPEHISAVTALDL